VTSLKKTQLVGRWFQLQPPKEYVLERRDTVKVNSVMRLDTSLSNFYVLKKHKINDANYHLSETVESVLLREVESLIN
jgi:hypothetical protein